jgi:hypothetical protein
MLFWLKTVNYFIFFAISKLRNVWSESAATTTTAVISAIPLAFF